VPCSTVSIAITFRSEPTYPFFTPHFLFLQQNLKVPVHFFLGNCFSQWDRRELISIEE